MTDLVQWNNCAGCMRKRSLLSEQPSYICRIGIKLNFIDNFSCRFLIIHFLPNILQQFRRRKWLQIKSHSWPPHCCLYTVHLTLGKQTGIPSTPTPIFVAASNKMLISKYVNFCSTCLRLQSLCIDRNGQSFIMFRRGQHSRQHLANTPLHLLVLSQPRLCYFWYIEHEGFPPPSPSCIFISLRV